MTQTPLFTAADLQAYLRQPVIAAAGAVVERVVWGWLSPVLGLTERPTAADVTPQLAAWALELGAIAYSNPEGLSSYQLESESSVYSSERRDQILLLAAGGGKTPTGAALAPTSSFPSARSYPDPAERCW